MVPGKGPVEHNSRGPLLRSAAPEIPLALRRGGGATLLAQLEDGLRAAVREGRLAAGSRLPSSRILAEDLGVSRRLVVDAYAQLLAEGYLVARRGSGTYVARDALEPPRPVSAPAPRRPRLDFFPGNPDLAAFPRREWLRAMRETLREMPDSALGYPDPRGARELREALAAHLRRVRGVVADPAQVVVCAGAAQALALLAQVLDGAPMAVEDPGLPPYLAILRANGARLLALPVDEQGARVQELPAEGVGAILVTPAHQSPTGVVLAPARRAALLAAAGRMGALVIEDDYDSEHRYDRAAPAAMQGMDPERVAYVGTASKSLAPALRLGWLVLPARLLGPVLERRALADLGSPTLEQLALARMLRSGAYDRHLRLVRRRYRERRRALAGALARHLPGARLTGADAGLHALVRMPAEFDGAALAAAAQERSVGVYPLASAYMEPRARDDGLTLGYAGLPEPAIEEGVRRLAEAWAEVAAG